MPTVNRSQVINRAESPELEIIEVRRVQPSAVNSKVPSNYRSTIKMEAEDPTRQQPFRAAAPIFAGDVYRQLNEVGETSIMAEMKSRVEDIYEEQPIVSRLFHSKQEMFERMYAGKTVTEIYEIMRNGNHAKRKRVSDKEGDKNMPLRKKTDQHGGTMK